MKNIMTRPLNRDDNKRRRMVTLDIKALRFALACIKDDRAREETPAWSPEYDAAEQHLVELIEKAQS